MPLAPLFQFKDGEVLKACQLNGLANWSGQQAAIGWSVSGQWGFFRPPWLRQRRPKQSREPGHDPLCNHFSFDRANRTISVTNLFVITPLGRVVMFEGRMERKQVEKTGTLYLFYRPGEAHQSFKEHGWETDGICGGSQFLLTLSADEAGGIPLLRWREQSATIEAPMLTLDAVSGEVSDVRRLPRLDTLRKNASEFLIAYRDLTKMDKVLGTELGWLCSVGRLHQCSAEVASGDFQLLGLQACRGLLDLFVRLGQERGTGRIDVVNLIDALLLSEKAFPHPFDSPPAATPPTATPAASADAYETMLRQILMVTSKFSEGTMPGWELVCAADSLGELFRHAAKLLPPPQFQYSESPIQNGGKNVGTALFDIKRNDENRPLHIVSDRAISGTYWWNRSTANKPFNGADPSFECTYDRKTDCYRSETIALSENGVPATLQIRFSPYTPSEKLTLRLDRY